MQKRVKNQRFFQSDFFSKNRRGEILLSNVVFIILNLVFLSILILFLLKQGSGAIVLEQSYAKQISLLIDSARPAMIIKIDMNKARKLAEKNGISFNDVVEITGNKVSVKLGENGGYDYYFFNDVEANPYPDPQKEGTYVITISEK